MRFGSVEFFKVLIKTVLAIFFFVPLILAVVFGVLWVNNNRRLSELDVKIQQTEQENQRLTIVADTFVKERAGTIESFNDIFKRSGLSFEEFIGYVNKKNEVDAAGFYNILSSAGVSDKDIISMAAAKKKVSGAVFYEIMSQNGITDKELITAIAAKNGGSVEDYYDILKQCGLSDEDIIAFIGKKNPNALPSGSSVPSSSSGESSDNSSVSSGESSSEQNSTSEPANVYEALYTDMYVKQPESYVRELGTIYLTFDDGPSDYTENILKYLKDYNIKATFFVVPTRTNSCYKKLRAIVDEGHSIGVHSATHEYNKIYASVEAYLDDFHEAWDIIRDATGVTTELFRFPGGSKNDFNADTRDDIIKEMTRRGFRFYDWNVESGDVSGATWTQMYNSIPRDIKNVPRSIVLMHDSVNCYNTVLVLEDVLGVLKKEGYKFDKINNNTQPIQFIGPFS